MEPGGRSKAAVAAMKAAVRSRDGHKCVRCGVTNARYRDVYGRQLDVIRVAAGDDFTADSFATVCKACRAR
jgi:hypothetical protein